MPRAAFGLLLAFLAWSTPFATAAPIRTAATANSVMTQALQANSVYFRNALQTRSLQVSIPRNLRGLRPMSDGTLPDSTFVDYLRWRWSLNPVRFAQYHPSVSRMILQDLQIRQLAQQVPQIVNPPGVKPSVITNPQTVTPPAVPEPSSLAILTLLFGASLWARRARRRAS
jgi:hypothetical protein